MEPEPATGTSEFTRADGPGRFRGFFLTWNNYPDNYVDIIRGLSPRHFVLGREVAPTTGTPHIQGAVYFRDGKTINRIRELLPGVHVEVTKSISHAITYCQKEGDFIEEGTRPQNAQEKGAAEKERWETAWSLAKDGDIELISADIRVRQYSTLRRIARDYMQRPLSLPDVCGVWICGPTGCGKTRSVFNLYPEAYNKPANKWWDGYQGEPVAVLDDVDPTQATWIGRFLKIWADRYAFISENKGSSVYIRPSKFIVTSQYLINNIFGDEETRGALRRRFREIEYPLGTETIADF